MTTQTFALTGLHCGACVNKVTQALLPLASSVAVSLQPMQVVLTGAKTDFGTLKTAVEGAGNYGLVPNQPSITPPAYLIPAQAAPENIAPIVFDTSWLTTYSPLLLIVA